MNGLPVFHNCDSGDESSNFLIMGLVLALGSVAGFCSVSLHRIAGIRLFFLPPLVPLFEFGIRQIGQVLLKYSTVR